LQERTPKDLMARVVGLLQYGRNGVFGSV
jgi:hypothetical protein